MRDRVMVKVTMVLAHGPGHPEGNLDDSMHLRVSLTPQGLLDPAAWETWQRPMAHHRGNARATRRARASWSRSRTGGRCASLGSEDEPLYSLCAQIVRPGEIVTVARLDGDTMLYRIVAVDAA